MQEQANLTEIALVVVAALTGGLGMAWMKQPPILGYIIAGILLGPSGFALIQCRDHVSALAELGVLLLLFVVGMELSLRTFKKVWVVSTLCTILQIVISLVITVVLSVFLGWSVGLSMLLGFVISLSSTAVAVKMLSSINDGNSEAGQITIGVLIAQDFAIVPMILILRNYGQSWISFALIFKMILAIGIIILLISYLSQRQKVRLPFIFSIGHERDLIPLISLTFCFAAAAISGLIGLSAAYGAFLAGLVLGNTHEWRLMLETTKPIQSILMMVFFLSIGLLLDLQFIWEHLGTVVLLIALITVGKTAINIGILRVLRVPWSQAFLTGVLLAQLGEFAFLMTTVGFESGIINEFGQKLIIALTVLSLAFSPLWMTTARKLKNIAGGNSSTLRSILSFLYGAKLAFIKVLWRKTKYYAKNPHKSLTSHDKIIDEE